MKHSIAIYLQNYLTPSMTFIYRQLKVAEKFFDPHVICSDVLANLDKFPFKSIYNKRRNFIALKKTRLFSKIYGWDKLLSINPRLSKQQNKIFRNAIVEKKIKLIHAHFGPAGLEIINIAKSMNIPLLVTFHGYDVSSLIRMEGYIKNLKKVFEYSSIIAVSNSMKDKLVAVGAIKDSISVIRCGIPVGIFNFVERESVKNKFNDGKLITFLQVSNFVEKKGHKYTLLAYKNFLSQYSNSILILGGDGPLRKNMQHFCVELGIEKNVKFMGLLDEKSVRQLMINSDVFLHHSVTSKIGDQEGIPTVIMEAMATGLPVISTNHSGISELIENNHDGFLVNEKDIKSYTDRLLNLHNLPDDIGIKARNKIEEDYNLKIETGKLIDLYNQHLK